MVSWLRVFRFYRLKVFPKARNFRGSTRFKQFLLEKAMGESLENVRGGYSMRINEAEVVMPEKNDFQEILGSDPLRGYTKVRDVRDGDIVVDAGAYPGVFTIYAAKKAGESGKVVALEPDSQNREYLRKCVELNGLNNVEVRGYGLWDEDGELEFEDQGSKTSRISEDSDSSSSDVGTVVEVRSLDSLVDELGLEDIDFVKMDIEGAEMEALKGSKNSIIEFKPYFAVASYHVREGEKTFHTVEGIFEESGLESKTGYKNHLTTYGYDRL